MTATGFDKIIKTHIHIPLAFGIQVALVAVILAEMNIGVSVDSGIYKCQLIAINFPGKRDVADKNEIDQTGYAITDKRNFTYFGNSTQVETTPEGFPQYSSPKF
ncbi:MAG: hypothetical protein KKD01_06030 [Proteobacteria bacterium]|nr:hypothetical protein [Pseudomonadota bacterium]MBU1233217.1 hypothetical protein [Pseudomonadota bacterium]MBU1418322.1 hypothetical protein [Pseudomonadota bacterium]MBU1454270.1 hypothetical protein [Pseudomonadota bacterium]